MRHETEKLLQKALSLPDSERAELAGNLIASLDENIGPDVDAAWQEEVARRWDEVRSGNVSTIPWGVGSEKGAYVARWQISPSGFIPTPSRSI